MVRAATLCLAGLLTLLGGASVAHAQSSSLAPEKPRPILCAHYPALSPDGKRLCFSYRGDLWTVSSQGGIATRLTVNPAYDAWPRWSPDGNWIAFSSNRSGNYDVYVIPARGGEPKQITYHSAGDYVCDWSPDGSQILFMSNRDGRFADLYTINLKDSRLRRITRDGTSSRYGAFLPDGRSIVYTRGGQAWWRPRYAGSERDAIYRVDVKTGATVPLVQHDGMDAWPLPAGNGKSVVFVSERDGASNLWKARLAGGAPRHLTHHTGHLVRFPTISRDGSVVAYECGFRIMVMALRGTGAGEPHAIDIIAPSDVLTNPVERVMLTSGVSGVALSPDGKKVAIVLNGDIWTIGADGGDATRLAHSPSLSEEPTWSADSATVAFTSARGGSREVYAVDVKMRAQTAITSDGAENARPQFAPVGRALAFVRKDGSAAGLYVVDVPASAPSRGKAAPPPVCVAAGRGIGSYEWSPDGRWIAYSRADDTSTSDIWIVRSVGGPSVNVTRYPAANTDPHWTRDGRRLEFASTRPRMGSGATANIYAIDLVPEMTAKRASAPVASASAGAANAGAIVYRVGPESQRRRRARREAAPDGSSGKPAEEVAAPRAALVRIEFDGIQDRARAITNLHEQIGAAQVAPDSRTVVFAMTMAGRPAWWMADLESGAMLPFAPSATIGDMPRFASDPGVITFIGAGGTLYRLARGSMAATSIAFRAAAQQDRRREMAESFEQAWRTLRLQFVDRAMNGVDWDALRRQYEPVARETTESEDLVWLLSSMVGELNASHLGAMAPVPARPADETGYLGLTFDQGYAGPGMRVTEVLAGGPADQPGGRIQPGWYVMAVDGKELTWGEDVVRALRNEVGEKVELQVAPTPSRDTARTIVVKPISRAAAISLEYAQWVKANRRRADDLSGGRVAYIHLRTMMQPDLEQFERELFGDARSKDALVLDLRYNRGGDIHNELLAALTRRPSGYEIPRGGARMSQPLRVWDRPVVLLQNEYSASDCEVFASGFREFHLGKIVGTPTPGEVIGTHDITLVDGTRFRVPSTAWVGLDGRPLENRGVVPDIAVDTSPADVRAGGDPQLDAAVREVLAEIARK